MINTRRSMQEFRGLTVAQGGHLLGDELILANKPTLKCNRKDVILIRFYDANGNPTTASGAGINSFSTSINNTQVDTAVLDANGLGRNYFAVALNDGDPLGKKICDTRHRDLIQITANSSSGGGFSVIARRENLWDVYGYNVGSNGVLGFWVPVGIFASNLKPTDQGIEFSAMPFGGALGGRWWLNPEAYLGFSMAGMYAIASTSEKTGSGSSTGNTILVSSAAAGVIVDISSYVYVSGTYQWRFAPGTPSERGDPGFMVGFGAGPGLLSLLAGAPK
jgi:hypothetical protein